MTTTLLALAWSLVTAAVAAVNVPPRPSEASEPARRPRHLPGLTRSEGRAPWGEVEPRRREVRWKGAGDAHEREPAAPRRGDGVLAGIGVAAVRGAAQALGRSGWIPADPRAVGAGIVFAGLMVAVLPAVWPGAVVVGVLPTLVARARRGRVRAAAGRAVLDELPEVIDLLGLAVAAGLTAPLAVAAVGRRGPGALAAALGEASAEAAKRGRRLADVLDDVPAALGAGGDGARPLLAALADSSRHGTSLGSQALQARRHRAEERARRVPILLLFPLITCTLPALGLLTIAPLAVGALRDLRA